MVVGALAGAVLRHGGFDALRRPEPPIGAVLYRELPRDDRRALRKGFQPFHDGRGDRRAAEAQAVLQALRMPQFDRAAAEALMSGHQKAREEQLQGLQSAWLDRVTEMTPQERQAYADRLEKALQHHGRGWGKKHHD